MNHGEGGPGVTLEEFQDGTKIRHQIGARGMETQCASATGADFS